MGLVRIAIVTTVAPPSESQYKMQLISRPYNIVSIFLSKLIIIQLYPAISIVAKLLEPGDGMRGV